jgi:Tfp pilus assembly protein PilX
MRKQLIVKSSPPPIPPPSRGRAREGGRNEKGFVLVVALLALLVITVLGVLALSTSTTEVMIAGNTRLREINFTGAQSGLEISDPAIRYLVYNQPTSQATCSNYSTIVNNCASLATELRTGPNFNSDSCKNNPNLQLTLGTMTVSVDIDRMFSAPCEGSATEFASGYEGVGMGGSGGTCAYYRVNSMSTEAVGSENVVGGVYRYVSY